MGILSERRSDYHVEYWYDSDFLPGIGIYDSLTITGENSIAPASLTSS
jgi:hypothetical protein